MRDFLIYVLIKSFIGFFMAFFYPGYLFSKILLDIKISKIERFIFGIASSIGFLHLIMTLLFVFNINVNFLNVIICEIILYIILLIILIKNNNYKITIKQQLKITFKINYHQIKKIAILTFPIIFYICFIIFLEFFHSLTSPVYSLWDSVMSYGTVSKYIYETGQWPFYDIFIPHATYEFRLSYTIMSWIFICIEYVTESGSIFTSFLSFLTIITLFSFSYRVNRNLFSSIFASVVILLSPIFVFRSMCLHIDIPYAFLFLVTIYLFYFFIENPKNIKIKYYVGFLLGILILTKISGILLLFSIILFSIIISIKDYKKLYANEISTSILIIIIISILISSIFFINNWIRFKNPFFPLFKFLGGDEWTVYLQTTINKKHLIHLYEITSTYKFILIQIQKLINLRTINPNSSIIPGLRENLFVIIICLIGLIKSMIHYKKNKLNLFLLVVSLIYFIWWWQSITSIRQLLPIFPILIVSASSFMKINIFNTPLSTKISYKKQIKKYLKISILFSLVLYPPIVYTLSNYNLEKFSIISKETGFYTAIQGKVRRSGTIKIFKMYSRPEAVKKRWGVYSEAWKFINTEVEANAVFLSDDPRIYYINSSVIWDQNPGINKIYLHEDISSIFKILKKYNVTHIYYSGVIHSYPDLYDSTIWQSLDNREIFEIIYQNVVKIYKIKWEYV